MHYFLFQDPDDAERIFDAIALAEKLSGVRISNGITIAHQFGSGSRSYIGVKTPKMVEKILITVYHFHIVAVQTDNDRAAEDFLEKRVSIADWAGQDKLEVRHTFQLFLKE